MMRLWHMAKEICGVSILTFQFWICAFFLHFQPLTQVTRAMGVFAEQLL